MVERPVWKDRLVAVWKQASIVWLTGPRRVGKTVLAQKRFTLVGVLRGLRKTCRLPL